MAKATAKTNVSRILTKLALRSRTQAAVWPKNWAYACPEAACGAFPSPPRSICGWRRVGAGQGKGPP
ncbi:MAG: hypothetical protein JWL99_3477 [Streptomyces oryziradicis]|nr:hypothetical protein [Actinacidiphila oryziradicis]